MTIGELLNMVPGSNLPAFEQQWLGYTETFGNHELREEIAKTYDTATSSNILCFAGAEEGVIHASPFGERRPRNSYST